MNHEGMTVYHCGCGVVTYETEGAYKQVWAYCEEHKNEMEVKREVKEKGCGCAGVGSGGCGIPDGQGVRCCKVDTLRG